MSARSYSSSRRNAPAGPGPAGGAPLPRCRHLPGSGTTPDLATLERALAAFPRRPDQRAAEGDPAYRYGWRLLESGYCWEAHEVWEKVWAGTTPGSAERGLLQCLIQVANARLKRRMGRPKAAERLKEMARALAADALGETPVLGMDRAGLTRLIDGS